MASLKLAASPEAALAASFPASPPNVRLKNAITTIIPPNRYTTPRSLASSPWSIMIAVINGIRISMITSRAVRPIHR